MEKETKKVTNKKNKKNTSVNTKNKTNKKEEVKEVVETKNVKETKKTSKDVKLDNKKVSKENLKKIQTVDDIDDLYKKAMVVMGVICFLCAFYILALFITNKNYDDAKNDSKEAVEISYENIIAGRSLSMSDDEYIVIYYDLTNDEINTDISTAINEYRSKDNPTPIYVVDMSKAINSSYLASSANKDPKNETELKISDTTLIKVNKGNVKSYVEGKDDVISFIG